DGGSEQEPLRLGGDRAEGYPGIRRRRAPDEGEVVPEEQRLPASRLGRSGQLDDAARVGVAAEVRGGEPEPQQQACGWTAAGSGSSAARSAAPCRRSCSLASSADS